MDSLQNKYQIQQYQVWSGKRVVPAEGPLDAEIIIIGESPAYEEEKAGRPFVGRSGTLLDAGLRAAGIDRSKCRILNLIPIRAPGDKFANHSPQDVAWGQANLARELSLCRRAKVYLCLGANPTSWLCGGDLPTAGKDRNGFIGQWRGSVIPITASYANQPENYLSDVRKKIKGLQYGSVIVPTYHPAAILRQFSWHPWFLLDLKTAACVASAGIPPVKYRTWYYDDPAALSALASSKIDLISVDTEMEPKLVSIATDTEVHVFTYDSRYHSALVKLLTSQRIVKVAHNWLHDHAWIRKQFGIVVARPYFDTQGAAHILNNALEKSLSPHISTRYTNWAYHKWLVNTSQTIYCGMDSVVCYDAYWNQIDELHSRGLYDVAEHDHKLLTPLMDMQAMGFVVDSTEQPKVERLLKGQLDAENVALQLVVQPIIDSRIGSFQKPHLFRVQRNCDCCGGGKSQMKHCPQCYWGTGNPVPPATRAVAMKQNYKTIKAYKAAMTSCRTCNGTGKVTKNLDFNSDSPDQLADVVYRGLKIRARKFKGVETTKAAQLDPIKDQHPVIGKIVEVSKIRADYDTVARLRTGSDGLLHCVFDPWGTASGRVAGKEGLVEVGTNPMNLPVSARRLVVPRTGKIFLYPDKAQIEARAVAVLSKDKNLYDALTQPVNWPGNKKHGMVDSHTKVVQLFSKNGVNITRDQAKRFTYAGIYGGGAKQLAVELNAEAFRKGSNTTLTTAEVQQGLDTFFKVFPQVKAWQYDIQAEVLRTRKLRCPYTERERTWTGYIYDSSTKELKHEIAKQVMSFLPQNMAAWILGLDLIDLYYTSGYYGDLLQPLIHVHDALLIEAPLDRLDEAKQVALKLLTRTEFGIIFPAEMKVGDNWYTASGGV